MNRLCPGDRVGDYVVSRFLAEGGNGAVYVARSDASDRDVALKLLSHDSDLAGVRFEREADVLRGLDHPNIVRLLAHGRIDEQPYLVMELLEGDTLEERLSLGSCPTADAVRIATQVASALGHAHARGVVHRDVKPGNVFLCGRSHADVRVLDFGIARRRDDHRVTRTGSIIGTPAYMAPEQARGDRGVDSRADVFALGCLLYEALSGTQAFAGEHVVAVLAKVLLDDPAPLRDVMPGIAPALDALVTRMLAKDPAERPADANAVLSALEALDLSHVDASAPSPAPTPVAITTGEQTLVSVILVQRGAANGLDATIAATVMGGGDDALRDAADRHGATVAVLADGTSVVSFSGRGSGVDRVARAALCALAIAAADRDVRVALATGLAETAGRWPIGPAIDRAAAVLSRESRTGVVAVDQLTTRLLESRYEIDGGVLIGPRANAARTRTLLGRPTPCVGREKELTLLESTLAECIDEPVARAVLVTAPPGVGKSRIGNEFADRARRRGHVTLLIARADPVGAGSSLGLIRQLVRAGAGLRDSDAADVQLGRIEKQLGRELDGETLGRMRDFLGELVGLRSTAPGPILRAAHNDPGVMSEWLQRAFDAWIGALCNANPLTIIVEDLHWGDSPSVAFLASALRRHAEKPLLVLALARTEIHDLFPRLWSDEGAQEIRLGGLTRKAAERLVRSTLGDAVTPERVQRIVARADGNAYYLEELIRNVAEGDEGELPETVLAMAQSRLDRLEPDARRMLRAASVFGETFFAEGVAALIGSSVAGVSAAMKQLVSRELVTPIATDRLSGEGEYAFRHGLLREAAYSTMKDADRPLAHLLAAEWLEGTGPQDAVVLAGHFERGGASDRAIPWLVRAVQSAVDAGDIRAGIVLIERAVALGASDHVRDALKALETVARNMIGDTAGALECGRRAIANLPPGSPEWLTAIGGLAFAAFNRTDATATREVVGALMALATTAPATGPYAFAMYCSILATAIAGQYEIGRALHERLEASARASADHDVLFAGYLRLARVERLAMIDGDLGGALRSAREAVSFVDLTGNAWFRIIASIRTGWVLVDIGEYAESETLFQRAVEWSNERRIHYAVAWSLLWMAKSRIYAGRPAAALDVLEPLRENANAIMADSVGAYWAEAALALDRDDDAKRVACEIDEKLSPPHNRVVRLTVLARVALRAGRTDEALVFAEAATKCFSASQECRTEVGAAHLVHYDVLVARNDIAAAERAIETAVRRVATIATTLGESELAAYLGNVAVNARTCSLANEHGVGDAIEHVRRRLDGCA